MGEPVQHEKPDYAYEPKGLMAESWGKTGHRTQVAEFIVAGNLRQRAWMDNDKTRDSWMYIQELDDATLLRAMLGGSSEHAEVCRRLGGSTWDNSLGLLPGEGVNPLWVTARCATEAYDRGLIDEREMDRIVDL